MVRMSLSCLSYVGLMSLMNFFESKLNVWKCHAGRDQSPRKCEARRWWQGSNLSWSTPQHSLAQGLALQVHYILGCKYWQSWVLGLRLNAVVG